MKKIIFALLFLFYGLHCVVYADFDREKIILEGLADTSDDNIMKYTSMAMNTSSEPIFDRLVEIYENAEPNSSQEIHALDTITNMTYLSLDKFAGKFVLFMNKYLSRLKKAGNFSNYTNNFYMYISRLKKMPYPEFDAAVENMIENIEEMLSGFSISKKTKEFYTRDLLNAMHYYMLDSYDPKYVEMFIKSYKNGTNQNPRIIDILTEHKNPALFKSMTDRLLSKKYENLFNSEFGIYKVYAYAINKSIPQSVELSEDGFEKYKREKRGYDLNEEFNKLWNSEERLNSYSDLDF